ncbi:MAG: preprotein translocase subunit SecG [Candidatus Magasanikbacteria bacterium]|nr:preprotein translocase subunit SecG [Candidatus Magasanikbacteria bacterium]
MLERAITIIQLATALLLIAAVLLQQQSAGVGGIFGGGSNVYSTKRGIDKILYRGTIMLAVIFFLSSLAPLLLRSPLP